LPGKNLTNVQLACKTYKVLENIDKINIVELSKIPEIMKTIANNLKKESILKAATSSKS